MKPDYTKSQIELVNYLFEGRESAISEAVTSWIVQSQRYAGFVEKYKDKIRKKLRVTREPGAALDLLYELKIPYLLLEERRFEISYEPYAAGKTRGPDFSVTYRTNFKFNLEVTHLHGFRPSKTGPADGDAVIDLHFTGVICSKLQQMLANMANILFIVSTARALESLDLQNHIAWIKMKAERKDPMFFQKYPFDSPADFYRYYQRLSGIVLYSPEGGEQKAVWLNPQARVKIPEEVAKKL